MNAAMLLKMMPMTATAHDETPLIQNLSVPSSEFSIIPLTSFNLKWEYFEKHIQLIKM